MSHQEARMAERLGVQIAWPTEGFDALKCELQEEDFQTIATLITRYNGKDFCMRTS